METGYRPIGDYGAIGDCRTMALVSSHGSIDWWCTPRFDAPSLFAKILDTSAGGHCSVEAPGLRAAGRRYLHDTAVLETRLDCDAGTLTVTDLLAVASTEGLGNSPAPYARQKLVRVVRCDAGRPEVRLVAAPRPGYAAPGRAPVSWRSPAPRTLMLQASGQPVAFRSTARWRLLEDGTAESTAALAPSDEIAVVIDYGTGDRAGEGVERAERGGDTEIGAGPDGCDLAEVHAWVDETVAFWRGWVAAGRFPDRYHDMVRRSAITLKLLTYHPSGAMVAAGTTSLPEEIGGERNWDYRFTWLRDATFTLYALHTLGYRAESDAFMSWLRRTLDERSPDPLILYRVDGAVPGRERVLEHLDGYRGSRPVRIGNGAAWQRQLDIYGEVLDAAYLDLRAGNEVTDHEWEILAHLADLAALRWRRTDTSIWEVRGGRRHFVYSKVLCWVALDRARRIAELTGRADAERDRLAGWEAEARRIRRAVFERGRRADGAFVQSFGDERIDASALVFPLVGFVRHDSPAAAATVRAVCNELADERGLVMRYRPDASVEGVAGHEGAFLICSYWLCDNLALHGDVDAARERFERLSRCGNDLGLFSEEWDPVHRRALGNFPQAFTHIALISTAHNLERAEAGRMQGVVRSTAPADEPLRGTDHRR